MYTLDAGSVGPQFGGFSSDYVLLIMNENAADKILSGKLKLGANAAAALGSSVATTEGFNDSSLGADVLIYSRSNGGVFAGVSLGDARWPATTRQTANSMAARSRQARCAGWQGRPSSGGTAFPGGSGTINQS